MSYALRVADLRAAGTAASRYSTMTNALGFALVISGTFSLLANGDLTGVVPLAIGIAILGGWIMGWVTGFMAGRRPDLLQEVVELTVTPDGIRTVMPSMSGEARWSSYKRVRDTGSSLLLELGTGPAAIVPTRALDRGQLEQLLAWADAADVLDRSSPLRAYLVGAVIGLVFNLVIFSAVVLSFNI